MEFLVTTGSQIIIAISGLLIITGVVLVKMGKEEAHKKAMLTACGFALVFVVLYLVRIATIGHGTYEGDYRKFYLFVLASHTLLAVINLPLAIVTVYLAFKGMKDKHKKIGPVTAAVWVYVALTGWLIFYFTSS